MEYFGLCYHHHHCKTSNCNYKCNRLFLRIDSSQRKEPDRSTALVLVIPSTVPFITYHAPNFYWSSHFRAVAPAQHGSDSGHWCLVDARAKMDLANSYHGFLKWGFVIILVLVDQYTVYELKWVNHGRDWFQVLEKNLKYPDFRVLNQQCNCKFVHCKVFGKQFLCMIVINYRWVEELVYYADWKEQYETLIHHYVAAQYIFHIL
jgi:hypothetical protein